MLRLQADRELGLSHWSSAFAHTCNFTFSGPSVEGKFVTFPAKVTCYEFFKRLADFIFLVASRDRGFLSLSEFVELVGTARNIIATSNRMIPKDFSYGETLLSFQAIVH